MPIVVDFEKARAKKKLTVAQLADLIGITQANLFVLKSNRGKAIRFSTLEALCRVLDCQPADILNYVPETEIEPKRSKK
ncbi:MAG: transcriptional regulator [Micrococcales bacterium]|nr:transcriptional regulator [Micrococcales bacterium]